MKRKMALLLATFSVLLIIALPAYASESVLIEKIVKPLVHGGGAW